MTTKGTNPQLEEKQELNRKLIHFVDDFAEFHSMNSFLIQAMASVMSSPEPVGKDVQQGAKLFALTLQSKSNELKSALNNFKENSTLSS
jgi:hypothetical protein